MMYLDMMIRRMVRCLRHVSCNFADLHIDNPFARHFLECVGKLDQGADELNQLSLRVLDGGDLGAAESNVVAALMTRIVEVEGVRFSWQVTLRGHYQQLHAAKVSERRSGYWRTERTPKEERPKDT